MKKLLVFGLVALMASGAMAQGMMGVFFTDDVDAINASIGGDAPNEFTNYFGAGQFSGYVVLLDPAVASVGAYEVSLAFNPPTIFLLGVTGPNGWTNYSTPTNHRAGYTTPLPCEGGVVLCTLNLLATSIDPVMISMGPAVPSSVDPASPVYVDGADPSWVVACDYTGFTENVADGAVVATVNGDGVVATEAHSLSAVKALFN